MKMKVDDVMMMTIHHQQDVVATIENVTVVNHDAIKILVVPIDTIIQIVVYNLLFSPFTLNSLTHVYSDHDRNNNRQRDDRNQDPDEFSTYGRPSNNHGDGFSRNRPR